MTTATATRKSTVSTCCSAIIATSSASGPTCTSCQQSTGATLKTPRQAAEDRLRALVRNAHTSTGSRVSYKGGPEN